MIDEWFSADGGFVALRPPTAHEPFVIAITAGEDDLGVALSGREAMKISKWLLRQVLGDDDYRVVRAVLDATRWAADDVEDERREAQAALADATIEAREEAEDRARYDEDAARFEIIEDPEPF